MSQYQYPYAQYPQYPYAQQPAMQQQQQPYASYYPHPQTYGNSQSATQYCASPGGVQSWVNFSDGHYLRGFVIGAGVAVLLTNPKVQQAVVKGAVSLWTAAQGTVEELKEKVQDMRAEMSHKGAAGSEKS